MTRFGRPHRHLRSTDSTNDRARELAQTGAPSGTIVTADEQSAGRGRYGRVWSAPPGKALLFSAILRPLDLEHALLPLAAPVAVCDAIESLAPVDCRIKWPNDVWIEERKVAGILIEARPPDWAVIGVGINVAIGEDEFPDDLRWPATSIGHGVGVEAARVELCESLGAWAAAPAATTVRAFREHDALAGRVVSWEGAGVDPGSGRVVDVDEDGNLLVEPGDGERLSLGSGEVSLKLTRNG